MRIFLMISAAAIIAAGPVPGQAGPGGQTSAAPANTVELAAATSKKAAKKPARKKKEKIEYMRATG
jgi:hypothetical protein